MNKNSLKKIIPNKKVVEELIKRSDNHEDTLKLINEFEMKKKGNSEFCINKKELDKILQWKLRDQYKRQEHNFKSNKDEIIKQVTYTVFKIEDTDVKYQDSTRIKLLEVLGGVAIPVATAILAISMPESYCVIDSKIKNRFFKDTSENITLNDYLEYLSSVRDIAEEYETTPQKVDMALWQYCIENPL